MVFLSRFLEFILIWFFYFDSSKFFHYQFFIIDFLEEFRILIFKKFNYFLLIHYHVFSFLGITVSDLVDASADELEDIMSACRIKRMQVHASKFEKAVSKLKQQDKSSNNLLEFFKYLANFCYFSSLAVCM